jgi:alanine racemase
VASDPATEPAGASLSAATAARNAWVEIDLRALESNLALIREQLVPGTAVIAVVKANAYGHGAAEVARALERAGVEQFAVAWLDEALVLREARVTRPIIVLEHTYPAAAPAAVAAGVSSTVHSRELAFALSEAALAAGVTAGVQVKVDTGLHRFGVTADEAVALAEYCRGLPGLRVEALWTHMANADEADDSYSLEQLQRFRGVRERLPWIPFCHTANSATTLRRPELHFDGVRTGLSLYGLCPPNTPDPGLAPLLSLKARLARVHALAAGDAVSYGQTWRASRDSVVGLVPVGYADGWRRSLSNRGHALVAGQRCPIIGRVCMDQLLVDLTGLPAPVREGEEVVLLGRQGDECISAEEVADLTETITWEVVSALLPRIPRIYHRDSCVSPQG